MFSSSQLTNNNAADHSQHLDRRGTDRLCRVSAGLTSASFNTDTVSCSYTSIFVSPIKINTTSLTNSWVCKNLALIHKHHNNHFRFTHSGDQGLPNFYFWFLGVGTLALKDPCSSNKMIVGSQNSSWNHLAPNLSAVKIGKPSSKSFIHSWWSWVGRQDLNLPFFYSSHKLLFTCTVK